MDVKWAYGNDVGDILTAIENAISAIEDAQEELRGLGEVQDEFGMLCDAMDALEQRKAVYEDRMSAEYRAQRAEDARDYYRGLL